MSSFLQYKKHIDRSGPELVLETAARDDEVSDAEYVRLWESIHPAKAKGVALKMRDRDYARATNG